ncbi:2-oxoacid:acceptor oxidoreductase family protein [Vulcanisaeta souniana]|uniref:pyruvate synthase n=1 Tax=Vulcanisaeta souniana JCM 11219 TaxID=1293586 RepID=A0A830E2G0_9CREN|nr:2-oxoacid:acceptor oxidoreductase family protein [Vulcanisaeta souniana]BDR92521.1 pyruvate/ketoisovalerate oxidoreductase subunit gamma [Vulcanisaeta souniana JCM 11219]GGI76138.1 pyruvate/ketoisovalerate oxidoreductase subunit gamma [Vulcanisaeta souniana JCM 11219]
MESETYEIIFFGRGGQGAVTAAQITALAAVSKGLYALAYPEFGPERRGAPVRSYLVVSTEPVEAREPIEEPNMSIVFGPDLLRVNPEIIRRTRDYIIINARRYETVEPYLRIFKGGIIYINAYDLSTKYLDKAIVNTAMLGALLRVFDILTVEDVAYAASKFFGSKLGKLNAELIRIAYNESRVIK